MEYFGSCLCKMVKYKVTGDFDAFYLCHCKFCRKDSGSAHAANLFSQTAQLEWLRGEALVRGFKRENTQHQKAFCQNCGCPLPHYQMEGKLLVVPAGSLDTPLEKVPDGHLFVSDKAIWDKDFDEIRRFDTYPNEKT